jgi:hypothetical protein
MRALKRVAAMKTVTQVAAAAALLCAVVVAGNAARAVAPAGRYTVAAMEVVDNRTGLKWQPAASLSMLTWAEATGYCAPPWRLPGLKELQSLVDVSVLSPSIDTTAFPGTPADAFWTSTTLVVQSTTAWYVRFTSGYTSTAPKSDQAFVRCVQ